MMHPDIEKALQEVVDELVDPDHVYLWLSPDFGQSLPAVLIEADQSDDSVLATNRAEITVYHGSRTAAKTLARTIHAHLCQGPHMTSAGKLDRVVPNVPPHNVPYPSDLVVQFSAVYTIDTRPV